MKGYGQFCPIAMACETFAERWTPLILRELLAGGRRFNEIRQGMPLISRTLLGKRLRELEAAGVVQSRRSPAAGDGSIGRRLRPRSSARFWSGSGSGDSGGPPPSSTPTTST